MEETPTSRPALSRALLLPGPQPPLSHLGVTLLRYAVTTGLRYSLYHLGLPVPEGAPVRIVRLRLYLDARTLRTLLTAAPGGGDVVGALLEPGATADRPATPRPLAATLSFHRLRLLPFRSPSGRPPGIGRTEPDELWRRFRASLTSALARTNDALLADVISSLDRRALRARGEVVPPVLSRGAWALRTSGRADLRRFGLPDPLSPCWADAPERAEGARHALALHPVPGQDRYRGRFREAYRAALSQLSPLLLELGTTAVRRGILTAPQEIFFLPLDAAEDLAAAHKPAWVADAVRNNRAEYESLRKAAEPLDLMTEQQEMTEVRGERPEWELGPLLPLP